ncbi:MAG: TIGR02281 family clan AA aspartic protease [Chitinivibrionia bacterium]|nr:TIGR02281 family clan AA aspartic protease [Chitinivibrionia bacterium]
MESQSLQRWALSEILIWIAAVSAGYLTFSSFGQFYDGVRLAAARAGYAHFFDINMNVPGVPRFSTQVLASAGPQLRGTIAARPNEPVTARKVILNANNYGHFHTLAEINGRHVDFMTDTGATYVALSYETAQQLGLAPQKLRFDGRSTTANGVARVASTIINAIRIGDISVSNVQAVIAEPGRMTQNLLGMSFIKQLSGFEVNGGTTLIMTE